jgi:hypothetical protein
MNDAVKSAIAEATQELIGINAQMDDLARLQSRKQTLEVFIAAARDVLRATEANANTRGSGLNPAALGWLPGDRLWEVIEIVMGFSKRPMTAGEILEALNAQSITIDGTHKRETVRSAIMRKEDIFERTGRGLFALRSWSEEMKRSRDSEPIPLTDDGGSPEVLKQ